MLSQLRNNWPPIVWFVFTFLFVVYATVADHQKLTAFQLDFSNNWCCSSSKEFNNPGGCYNWQKKYSNGEETGPGERGTYVCHELTLFGAYPSEESCLADCVTDYFCGDGQLTHTESCGEPGAAECPEGQSCNDCHCVVDEVPICGNAIVEAGEECDSTGCNHYESCDPETCECVPVCGNGFISGDEQCEWGLDACGDGYQCSQCKCVPRCEYDSDCNDGDACTDDICLFGSCTHPDNNSCCNDDSECQDVKPECGLCGSCNERVQCSCNTVPLPGAPRFCGLTPPPFNFNIDNSCSSGCNPAGGDCNDPCEVCLLDSIDVPGAGCVFSCQPAPNAELLYPSECGGGSVPPPSPSTPPPPASVGSNDSESSESSSSNSSHDSSQLFSFSYSASFSNSTNTSASSTESDDNSKSESYAYSYSTSNESLSSISKDTSQSSVDSSSSSSSSSSSISSEEDDVTDGSDDDGTDGSASFSDNSSDTSSQSSVSSFTSSNSNSSVEDDGSDDGNTSVTGDNGDTTDSTDTGNGGGDSDDFVDGEIFGSSSEGAASSSSYAECDFCPACVACKRCGIGLGNLCDEAECSGLGACVFEDGIFSNSCIPDPGICSVCLP